MAASSMSIALARLDRPGRWPWTVPMQMPRPRQNRMRFSSGVSTHTILVLIPTLKLIPTLTRTIPCSYYSQFASQDIRPGGPNPWKVLQNYLAQKGARATQPSENRLCNELLWSELGVHFIWGFDYTFTTIIYENPLVSFKSHILPEGWNSISCCLLLLLLFFVQIKLVKSYSSPHIDTTLPAETLFGSLRAASARSTDYRCHPDGLPVQPLICFRYVYYASYLCVIMIEWFLRFLSLYVIYSLIVWITSTAHRL